MPKITPITETEFTLETNGYSFHICLGNHTSGNYIAIPDWGVCSEATDWNDTFYNATKMHNSSNEVVSENSQMIAQAIKEYTEEL